MFLDSLQTPGKYRTPTLGVRARRIRRTRTVFVYTIYYTIILRIYA